MGFVRRKFAAALREILQKNSLLVWLSFSVIAATLIGIFRDVLFEKRLIDFGYEPTARGWIYGISRILSIMSMATSLVMIIGNYGVGFVIQARSSAYAFAAMGIAALALFGCLGLRIYSQSSNSVRT
jgi:hypothetical protein